MDRVGRVGNADGMGRGSGILREETWDLVDLYPIDPALHGAKSTMIYLRHIDGLVDHEDQVVPCVMACIPDGSVYYFCLMRRLQGVKTTDHDYIRMLVYD